MDMEKHICKNSTLECKFYCVQPIHIENSILIELFNIKILNDELKPYISKENPSWYNDLNKELYTNMLMIDLDFNISDDILLNELENKYKVNEKFSLSKYLSETKYYILFDYKLMYFNLFFELTFNIDTNYLDSYLVDINNQKDFYNCVRNVLVKENDETQESIWARKIKVNSIKNIKNIIEKVYAYKIEEKAVYIENNTGNITNIVDFTSFKKNNDFIVKYSKKMLRINDIAERLTIFKKPIILSYEDKEQLNIDYSSSLYHFNGRFHTITIQDKKDKYRYVPIQVHIQYMWFYLKKINAILESQYNKIMLEDTMKNINMNSDMIDNLIHKIEILTIHNEKLKLNIEGDNSKIYERIQASWNVENMLINSNRYINYFKDYLTRIYTKHTSKVEQRQNTILLFISIFQFAALISVWNDYLALLDDKDIKEKADEIIPLFGTYETLEYINLYSPIVFAILISLMIWYIYRNK